jgi:hypothetical protein
MTIVNTNFVFAASAESVVTWGRTLTSEELNSVNQQKGSMFAQGKFGSFPALVDGVQTYQWTTSDAATEWVAFCNTFTPPPTSAIVQLL